MLDKETEFSGARHVERLQPELERAQDRHPGSWDRIRAANSASIGAGGQEGGAPMAGSGVKQGSTPPSPVQESYPWIERPVSARISR